MKQQLRQISSVLAIGALLCGLGAVDAGAHEVNRSKGFYLGSSLMGSSIDIDEDPGTTFRVDSNGGGVTLEMGYSFNSVFSLELVLAATGYETSDPDINAGLGAVQVFAHYQFRPGSQMRPFVKGGFGGYGLRIDDGAVAATANGGGLAFGGGIDYFFNRHFAMGIDVTHSIIDYNELEFDFGGTTTGSEIDEEGTMTTTGLTFNFYF